MRSVVFLQKRDFLGNRLIHLPLLYALKYASVDNEIIVFSPFKSVKFFKDVRLASEVHVYSYGPIRMLRRLRRLKPDLIISLRPRSEWLCLAIGLSGAKVRVSFSTAATKMFFTHTMKSDYSIYRALSFLRLLELIGISAKTETFFRELAKHGTLDMPDGPDYFCLIPGGGAGEFKRWGIRNYLGLYEKLKEYYKNAAFIFLLGDAEKDYLEKIQSSSVATHTLILQNESMANIARAIGSSKVTIANDTGPAQIAQMMKVPYVGIFSNHDGKARARIGEWFYKHENALAVTTEDLKDIKTIPVERVETAVRQLLIQAH
jgi:ADP-heptose:LPS heptosyltransferase